jgi:hypothetical protein
MLSIFKIISGGRFTATGVSLGLRGTLSPRLANNTIV